MNTKVCTKCGVEKPLEEFYKDSRAKCGRCGPCKDCDKELNRKWRASNPGKCLERNRLRRECPTEKERAMRREWKKANSDKCRESARKYRENNWDKVDAYNVRRELKTPDDYPPELIELLILKRQLKREVKNRERKTT